MKREILNPDELNAALEPLNDWAVNDKTIIKQLKFENFATALEFVNKVGALAEKADLRALVAPKREQLELFAA